MKNINWIKIFFGSSLLIFSCYTFSKSDEDWKSPAGVAERKANWMYKKYLDSYMAVPAVYPLSLAFRIENNISMGAEKDNKEFYLLGHGGSSKTVEIIYPVEKSLWNQLYDYFLKNPKAAFDSFKFSPSVIKKEISFAACQNLVAAIEKTTRYINTSLMSQVDSGDYRVTYSLGYTEGNFQVLYRSHNEKEQPFNQLLEIKKMAEICADSLPTVEEKAKLMEEDHRKNYKGKIFDSPPLIILHVGDKKFESFLGTFCWPIDTHNLCSDSFANITAKKPIHLKQGNVLSFEIPELENLENISIAIEPVSSKDISKDKHCDGHCIVWEKAINSQESTVKALQSIPLNDKGEYVIVLSGLWNLYGDAEHSFYIKVE